MKWQYVPRQCGIFANKTPQIIGLHVTVERLALDDLAKQAPWSVSLKSRLCSCSRETKALQIELWDVIGVSRAINNSYISPNPLKSTVQWGITTKSMQLSSFMVLGWVGDFCRPRSVKNWTVTYKGASCRDLLETYASPAFSINWTLPCRKLNWRWLETLVRM